MLRTKALSFLAIGLLFLSGCAASGPTINTPVRQGAAVPAPVYRDGDQWAYQVVRSNGNNEKMQINYRNGKFESDNPALFDSSLWASVYRKDEGLKPLTFPLASGKGWSYSYQGTSSRGRTSWRDAEVKVIGPTLRPVKTKAGQFKAVEIQRIESWGSAERKTTYFYGPDTKSVVKLVADTSSANNSQHYEMELVQYKNGR
jgi:hypothetical protein